MSEVEKLGTPMLNGDTLVAKINTTKAPLVAQAILDGCNSFECTATLKNGWIWITAAHPSVFIWIGVMLSDILKQLKK